MESELLSVIVIALVITLVMNLVIIQTAIQMIHGFNDFDKLNRFDIF